MNELKEHTLIIFHFIQRRPSVFFFYLILSLSLSTLVSQLHFNNYVSSTRILVEETSRFSSILSGHYTPRSNIKEEISNLKEICQSRDFLVQSMTESGIIENWNNNKPRLHKLIERAKKILRIDSITKNDGERLLNHVRSKLLFYREENTIVIQFTWHNKYESKSFVESMQSQLIERNKKEQTNKSKDTIHILSTIKNEVDESIARLNLELSDQNEISHSKQSTEVKNNTRVLNDKKTRLASLDDKIFLYERKQDEIKIDAEETMRRLRTTLGPDHPDLKLAQQAANNRLNRSRYLKNLNKERDYLQSEISSIESFLHLNQVINTDKENFSPKSESILNELRLLSVRRQELEQRMDDAKKALRSTNNLLATTLTVTVPPILPRKPSSKSTEEITMIAILLSFIFIFSMCYFHGFISDIISTEMIVERRHDITRL